MSTKDCVALAEFEDLVHNVARERWACLTHGELLDLAARQLVAGGFMSKVISEQEAEIARLRERIACQDALL